MEDITNNPIERVVECSRLAAAASAGARPGDIDELRRRVGEGLRALDPSAADHERQSTRAFIVAVLSWQFGQALLQDPRASAMIDSIEQSVAAWPEAGRRLAKAIAALTADQ